jgi:hypothetical protein
MTRRTRRRQIEAELAAREAAQDAPIPGLDAAAKAGRWEGPLPDPSLDADDTIGCIGRLNLGLHGAHDPDRRRRSQARQQFLGNTSPTYCPLPPPRLVHCYGGQAGGRSFVVGNAHYTSAYLQPPAGYGGPMPPGDELAAAFCALRLDGPWHWVQIIPAIRGWLSGKNDSSGHPALDARYTTYCTDRTHARQIVGPALAAFVASRDGWAFSLYGSVLACVTIDPLATGQDAEQLVDATARAAAMLGT